MKTKLLKKVRRRFTIMHYPKGRRLWNNFFEANLFYLQDNKSSFNSQFVQVVEEPKQSIHIGRNFSNEQDAINHLKNKIIKILKSEGYGNSKEQKAKLAAKKVWWTLQK